MHMVVFDYKHLHCIFFLQPNKALEYPTEFNMLLTSRFFSKSRSMMEMLGRNIGIMLWRGIQKMFLLLS